MKQRTIKRIVSTLLAMVMLIGLLPTAAIPVFASEESENEIGEVSDGGVIEVSSWDEFEEAFALSDFHYTGESYTIKLMEDLHFNADDAPRSAEVLVDVHVRGCFVTLDFNGHTLSCKDNDMDSELSDFIRINLHALDYNTPIEFILTDSVGGGGVSMNSYRWTDTELSALHIVDTRNYMHWGAIYQECQRSCKLTINGGNYTLNATTSKFSDGTLSRVCSYRGTVIADNLKDIEINGGTFTAKSGGVVTSFADMCARELSAFATVTSREGPGIVWTEYPVINGGTFISDGYAIHHFDCAYVLGESEQTVLPMINGGVFSGGIAYIGKTFTYSDGDEELENKKASEIINNDAYVVCIKDGNIYGLEDDLDLGDLHDADSLYVLSKSLFELNILPDVGEITDIERYTEQSDTYQVQYKVPYGFTEDQITPYIAVTPTGGMTATYQTTQKVINYSDYEDGLTVKAGIAVTVPGEVLYFENTYNVAVSVLPLAPEILAQPYSMTVAPGECAEAMVVANHAVSYQWYYLYDGSSPMKLTESLVSAMGGGVTGYTSPRLSVTLDGVGREYFQCYVTGTDGSTVKTNRISFTYGTTPSEKSFGGGEYLANGNAEFKLFAQYAETVTWKVMKRLSGSSQIYTLEEFKELTGCEYKTTHKGYLNGLYCATVVFENVDESFSGKYLVGYTMKNSLGSVTVIDPADMVPFTLVEPRPIIQTFIESKSCYEGGRMTFSFSADDMDYAEWIFEKPDEDGVAVAYDIEEMKELFPEVTFEESLSDNVATLKISNAQTGLSEYMLYAYGGLAAESCAGSAEMRVIEFTYVRPAGDGSEGNPFQITNICELYWFAAFVNYEISIPADVTVAPNQACAKLMNDITVNPDLLTDDYALNVSEEDADYLLAWVPLCTTYYYKGTFDGQNHTISGIYCVPQPTRMIEYGLFGRVEGGSIRNLTLKDSYFRTPLEYVNNMGGFVGRLTSDSTVENCHFDGTVTTTITKDSDVGDYYQYGRIAGIVCMSDEETEIRDCTVKGLISGYGQLVGGIVGSADGEVIGCVNEATVKNTINNEEKNYTAGIVAILNNGTINDCCNKGTVIGNTAGGIVDTIDVDGTVKNCHFDGSVVSLDGEGSEILGGIAATNSGNIQNCTVKGEVSGYATNAIGGIVGVMVQGNVTDCVNEARVENLVSLTGRDSDYSGGIVGTMATGTIQNCCNKGDVSGNNSGGIVGGAGWAYNEGATIMRCWNEGTVDENGAGIAYLISGDNVTIKNCYNAGSVRYGIVSSYTGSGHSVTYCHNVGELTAGFNHGAPIILSIDDDTEINVANCYYLADSELDEIDGTTAMSSDRFSRQDIQMVTKLLNSGNAGQWEQGPDYPVLAEPKGVTISGTVTSFNSDTDNITIELFAEGSASAAFTATVKGNSAEYAIEGVAEGTYTMKVSKNNHVTREYTIEVGTEDLIQDAKIHLKGDINGDGKITIVDANRSKLHFKNKSILSGYELLCADVNGDGTVTIVDVNRMNLHFKNKNKLW
ncbi:MAG: dockerin type I repeat-containing protein [Clostridia bacterium]|nr:dockerin type I repeat-containing protein [Clostridia bacterium]